MTSLFIGEQEETLFLLHEQPPTILQQSESLDGIKSMQQILSASSSITSTLPNQQQQNSRPLLSSNELIPPPLRFSSNQSRYTNSNDSDSFVRQFERRLDEHRILSQKDYDRKIQQIIETKNTEFEGLKLRYESKLNEFEDNNRQLEIQLGQINEENKRLKIELEHEKQQNKLEYMSTQQHLKESENDAERKLHEMKVFYENEKQEIKRQHSRTYQDLLDETNQRLKKMENDYKYQQSTNESIIDEMEKRMVDLRSNIEYLQQIKQKIDEDKSQLMKNNEKLQLQVQDLTNKQRHVDRDHADKIQRYENDLKSVRVRCESSIDLLRKENDVIKSKSSQTIDDLENKLTTITEKFHEIAKLYERKCYEQEQIYTNNMKKCQDDYEKEIQRLNEEHNQQLENELQQQKDQIQINLENHIQEINEQTRKNEQQLVDKVKIEYEQLYQQNEEKLRQNFNKEIEEIKRKYEQKIEKKEEKMKIDLQEINKLSVEIKHKHENEKQQLINEYDQFIRKLENEYSQKTDEYEKGIETVISKAHEQFKSMEAEFEVRHAKQQSIINDQQKLIQKLHDEKNHTKLFYEKQNRILTEQSAREKNEIQSQFDSCMKNLEKTMNTLTLKNEQLERELIYVNEQHKHEMIECRLSNENNLKHLLSHDVHVDLENTIYSLKQQVVYLQQRIAFLQQELEQYIQIYGHRP